MNPKRLFKTLISTALVGAIALTALPVTALAADTKSSAVDPSKYLSDTFFIKNKNSGKYLDVKGGSAKNGANVIQWGFTGKNNQQWKLQKQSNGTYKLVSALSTGYALDIAGKSNKNGANAQIWKSSQTFKLVKVSGTYYKLESTVSGSAKKTIGVSGASKKDGANVNHWTFGKNGNDQWQFERVVKYDPYNHYPASRTVDDIDIDALIAYGIKYGESIGMKYDPTITKGYGTWDTPIAIHPRWANSITESQIRSSLNGHQKRDDADVFGFWYEKGEIWRSDGHIIETMELYVGYGDSAPKDWIVSYD